MPRRDYESWQLSEVRAEHSLSGRWLLRAAQGVAGTNHPALLVEGVAFFAVENENVSVGRDGDIGSCLLEGGGIGSEALFHLCGSLGKTKCEAEKETEAANLLGQGGYLART